ncbi:uncharacterized protein N7482_009370 [Penicillium canariense]|uniref:Uncharacterized protein n=1 Tax=Penicillium canariense TaxID=189055 RepID=A0A9W9HQ71_9EURO|nr:uncharacterized protein N7482_009370 [Penicillium canariense]KAJ5152892.1 hypothetical protein N7482_009370 [Penicillium canariense]
MGLLSSAFLGLFAVLVAVLAPTVIHLIRVGGPFLTPNPTVLGAGQGPIVIEDTIHCEDVHHYRPADLLFTACEDLKATRFDWFPGLGHLDTKAAGRGSIHVVDPKVCDLFYNATRGAYYTVWSGGILTSSILYSQTFKSTRLTFENFESGFVTHGIDVIEDPERADAVYIFAINHLPNPEYSPSAPTSAPKARSQIELFHHILRSTTVQHVRSIRHELIQTPNDITADSPSSFYVTNDHYYRAGLLRLIEDLWPFAKWSNIIHVQLHELQAEHATSALTASVAHAGLWNNNGLGHARHPAELIISSAMGGELYLATRDENNTLSVHTTIPFDTTTDNPSYYVDPFASDVHDASGLVVAGISQAVYMPQTMHDPDAVDALQVWYAKPTRGGTGWETRLLFEDDGTRIRTGSAAVLVPVEPERVEGVKKAWLFVTGFLSENMIAVQVEL